MPCGDGLVDRHVVTLRNVHTKKFAISLLLVLSIDDSNNYQEI